MGRWTSGVDGLMDVRLPMWNRMSRDLLVRLDWRRRRIGRSVFGYVAEKRIGFIGFLVAALLFVAELVLLMVKALKNCWKTFKIYF